MSVNSSILEDIMALREAKSASLAYFYFDFRDEDKRSGGADAAPFFLFFHSSPRSRIFAVVYSLDFIQHMMMAHESPAMVS
jgi:hypothetical protein